MLLTRQQLEERLVAFTANPRTVKIPLIPCWSAPARAEQVMRVMLPWGS
jgi:hypothetical protein